MSWDLHRMDMPVAVLLNHIDISCFFILLTMIRPKLTIIMNRVRNPNRKSNSLNLNLIDGKRIRRKSRNKVLCFNKCYSKLVFSVCISFFPLTHLNSFLSGISACFRTDSLARPH